MFERVLLCWGEAGRGGEQERGQVDGMEWTRWQKNGWTWTGVLLSLRSAQRGVDGCRGSRKAREGQPLDRLRHLIAVESSCGIRDERRAACSTVLLACVQFFAVRCHAVASLHVDRQVKPAVDVAALPVFHLGKGLQTNGPQYV